MLSGSKIIKIKCRFHRPYTQLYRFFFMGTEELVNLHFYKFPRLFSWRLSKLSSLRNIQQSNNHNLHRTVFTFFWLLCIKSNMVIEFLILLMHWFSLLHFLYFLTDTSNIFIIYPKQAHEKILDNDDIFKIGFWIIFHTDCAY